MLIAILGAPTDGRMARRAAIEYFDGVDERFSELVKLDRRPVEP